MRDAHASERNRVRRDDAGIEPVKAAPRTPRQTTTGTTSSSAPVTPLASRQRLKAPPAERRARRPPGQQVTDLWLMRKPTSTPTRSEGAIDPGAKERSAMRKVALDLGVKKTTYCEVSDGAVVRRTTVGDVELLRPLLGPDQGRALVAIEAGREASSAGATKS